MAFPDYALINNREDLNNLNLRKEDHLLHLQQFQISQSLSFYKQAVLQVTEQKESNVS